MINYDEAKQWWLNVWKSQGDEYGEEISSSQMYLDRSRTLVEMFAPVLKNIKKFCELGIGSGRNIHFFHKAYPEWEYYGCDINPDVHRIIEANFPDVLEYAEIVEADIIDYLEAIPPMDVIFTHGVLIHIPDDAINVVCKLMAKKARYLLLHEATGRLHGVKDVPHEFIRYERDYFDKFPGFMLKKYLLEQSKIGRIYSFYIFEKYK